jgi:hypothetical protein
LKLDELKDLFPVSDYISLTGRCPRLAYQDVKRIPHIRLGREILIVKSGFLKWLEDEQKKAMEESKEMK